MSSLLGAKRSANGGSSSLFVRNTILVLSGYLLGTTAAHFCWPTTEACAFGAGLIGMIAYGLLAWHASSKQSEQARLAVETAAVKLERRVEEHVRAASARLLLKVHAARRLPQPHEQYVTVVRASRSLV